LIRDHGLDSKKAAGEVGEGEGSAEEGSVVSHYAGKM
jgi:hypothetical protein